MPRLLLLYQFNSTYWYGRYHDVFLVMCPSFLHSLLSMILARSIIVCFFILFYFFFPWTTPNLFCKSNTTYRVLRIIMYSFFSLNAQIHVSMPAAVKSNPTWALPQPLTYFHGISPHTATSSSVHWALNYDNLLFYYYGHSVRSNCLS